MPRFRLASVTGPKMRSTIWCLAFVILYALHAIGCAFGWPATTLRVSLAVVLLLLAYFWVLSGYRGDLPYLLRLSIGRLMLHVYPLALVAAASGIAALAPRPPRA